MILKRAAPTSLQASSISLSSCKYPEPSYLLSILFYISSPFFLNIFFIHQHRGGVLSPQGRRCQQEDGGRGKREGLQGLHSSSRGPSGGSSEWGGGRPADLINDSEAADSSLSHFTPETKKKRPDFQQPNVRFIFNIKEFIITDDPSG